MGVYLNGVREALQEWHDSPTSAGAKSMEGFDGLYSAFMSDDKFTMAVVNGAERLGTSFLGFVKPEAMETYLNKLDDVAVQYGGSYKPLLDAYKNDPDVITAALKEGDMGTIKEKYSTYTQPDMSDGVMLTSNRESPVSGEMFADQSLRDGNTGRAFEEQQSVTPNMDGQQASMSI